MAPVEPEATSRSIVPPLAFFSAQTLVVILSSAQVLYTARKASRALPPPTSTRAQQSLRRRHATVFSILAFLSLASVTTFAVMWRALSYLEWADKGNHQTPGSLWTGWYGTGEQGVGKWRLGDWLSDVNLARESDAVSVLKPEGHLYTSQHWVGLAATAMFIGIEGKRRNLSTLTISSFITLGATGSLSYALSLFFVTVLYTPLVQHNDDTPGRDALFTPKPAVYYVPIIVSVASLYLWPSFLTSNADSILPRVGYVAVPLFLAFAPRIIPTSWGHQHVSKASAHRSFIKPFYALSLASFFLYCNLYVANLVANTPPEQASVYDLLKNAIGKQDHSKTNRLLIGIQTTAQNLKLISKHPAASVTLADVLFTVIGLLTWAFMRNLDVHDILENSMLSFVNRHPEEKHVAFQEQVKVDVEDEGQEPTTVLAATPRKRGRPRKQATTNGTSSPASSGSVRRSTRRKTRSDYESDAESTYEPTTSALKEVTRTETDGATPAEDVVQGGEATALGLFLSLVGGLGHVAGAVLGAEVTSVNG